MGCSPYMVTQGCTLMSARLILEVGKDEDGEDDGGGQDDERMLTRTVHASLWPACIRNAGGETSRGIQILKRTIPRRRSRSGAGIAGEAKEAGAETEVAAARGLPVLRLLDQHLFHQIQQLGGDVAAFRYLRKRLEIVANVGTNSGCLLKYSSTADL